MNKPSSLWQGTLTWSAALWPHLRHCRALFALVALSLICGDNWVVMKVALAHSLDFAGLRTLLGALVLFVVLLWRRAVGVGRHGCNWARRP